jgi:hypothetical protein
MARLRHRLRNTFTSLGFRLSQPDILDGAVLILTLTGAWLMALHQGGARAEGLVYGARCILAAACLHGASAATRRKHGYRFIHGGWLTLPFIGWLAIDAVFLAPDRGAALEAWVVALLGAAAFWMTLHHARRHWSQAIALLLVVGPASLMASGSHDREGGQVRALLGLQPDPVYAAHFTSAFGSPGASAAILLLALMPALAAAFNSRHRPWLRGVAGYFAVLLLVGLHQTHHGWAWVGLALAAAFAGYALRRKGKNSLLDLRVFALLALLVAWASGRFANLGVFRGSQEIGATPLADGAWQSLLNDPVLGGGSGSYPLSFEMVRPHAWQTDPAGPGSLLLQIISEHGLLGLGLVGIPLAAVLVACARSAFANPKATQPGDQSGLARQQSRRTMVAGGLAGVGAALWTLCWDYAGNQPGIILLILLVLAVVYRASECSEETLLDWPEKVRTTLTVAAVLLPLAIAPLALSPLQAARLAQPATETINDLSPTSIGVAVLLKPAEEESLREAVEQLARSLRLNPLHAARHATRAQALALLLRESPDDSRILAAARDESSRAVKSAPRLAWPHLVHGSILLSSHDPADRAAGLAEIDAAATISPRNQAVTLRRAQALGQVSAAPETLRSALEQAQLTSPQRPEVAERLSLLPAATSTR